MKKAQERYDKYVNSEYKRFYSESGRDRLPIPSDQEAITGCKRLFRKFMGYSFKDKIEIVRGNKYTNIRRGVMYINPNRTDNYEGMLPSLIPEARDRFIGIYGGWEQIVHTLSHWIAHRKFDSSHDTKHLWLEVKMVRYVFKNKFHLGALKSKKKVVVKDPIVERAKSVERRIVKWETKLKRTQTALKKLRKQQRYYEKKEVLV